jgi:hypothetical protein
MKKIVLALCILLTSNSSSHACTAFEFGGYENGGIAHNLDWYSQMGSAAAFFVNARGTEKQGEIFGALDEVAHWTSKYGSLTYSITGREFPSGGRNEAGLSIQALMFTGRYPTKEESSAPALGATQWVQYQLDNSATLAEAVANAAKIRPVSQAVTHYFVCDKSHSCGVFQFVNGELKIYRERGLLTPTLTNSSYPESLQYWKDCLDGRCPPVTNSLVRFAKAASSRGTFRSGVNPVEFASSQLEGVVQTGAIETRYSFVDFKDEIFFTPAKNWQGWQSIDLAKLDFSCANAGAYLEIDPAFKGDQTANLKPFEESIQAKLAAQMPLSPAGKKLLIDFPRTKTRCTK